MTEERLKEIEALSGSGSYVDIRDLIAEVRLLREALGCRIDLHVEFVEENQSLRELLDVFRRERDEALAEVRRLQVRVSTLEKVDKVNCAQLEIKKAIISKLDPARILSLAQEYRSLRELLEETARGLEDCDETQNTWYRLEPRIKAALEGK